MGEHATPMAARPAAPSQRHQTERPESLRPLLQAVTAVAGAADATGVAGAAVTGAVELTGARAAALGVRSGERVRLLASRGYDCDTMTAGASLPLNAGLPLTESVRTGTTVIRGAASSTAWVAVPVRAAGVDAALLVSLPPTATIDVAALEALGRVSADALSRAAATELVGGATPTASVVDVPGWLELAVAHEASRHGGSGSGDVIACVDGAATGVTWLVVADVCGTGAAAAPTAGRVAQLVRTLATADLGPEELLAAADRALQREAWTDRFVTAVAARLVRTGAGVQVEIASAGHPPPLVFRDGAATELPSGGSPLNLLPQGNVARSTATLALRPGELLLLHTDGLVDRGNADRTDDLVSLLGSAGALRDPRAVLDVVLHGLTATSDPPRDDVAVAIVTPR